MKFPLFDKDGELLKFNSELEANIEIIFLQPKYRDLLSVYHSHLL